MENKTNERRKDNRMETKQQKASRQGRDKSRQMEKQDEEDRQDKTSQVNETWKTRLTNREGKAKKTKLKARFSSQDKQTDEPRFTVTLLHRKFFILEMSTVCSNEVRSLNSKEPNVFLCLIGIMRVVIWSKHLKEFRSSEPFSCQTLVAF